MSEHYEFSDGGIEDASCYLGGNMHLKQLADDCIAATGAKVHEVLLVMLFEIEGIANEHGIPLCDNASLVELLITLELGDAIPEALYVAVAYIISFAYQLQGKTPLGWEEDIGS